MDDPKTIEVMKIMYQYFMYPPNSSPDSLDNKSIEFNSTLTAPPKDLGVINGFFTIYVYYHDGPYDRHYYPYMTAHTMDFTKPGRIEFKGPTGIYCVYNYNTAMWENSLGDQLNSSARGPDGSIIIDPVGNVVLYDDPIVFEDFKYTGLENNEEFMEWVSKNAKIRSKKNRDKKISNLNRGDLVFYGLDSLILYPFDKGICSGELQHDEGTFLTSDFYANGGSIQSDAVRRVIESEGALGPGDYNCVITIVGGGCYIMYENGFQEYLNSPITIKNCRVEADPDIITCLSSDEQISFVPENIQRTILKLLPTLDPGATPALFSGCRIGAVVSYKLGERERTQVVNYMMKDDETGQLMFYTSYRPAFGQYEYDLGYSYREGRWYCIGSDGTPSNELTHDVTFKYFTVKSSTATTEQISELYDWIRNNSVYIYASKGINTFDELLTEISDVIRSQRGYGGEINAQDIVPLLLSL